MNLEAECITDLLIKLILLDELVLVWLSRLREHGAVFFSIESRGAAESLQSDSLQRQRSLTHIYMHTHTHTHTHTLNELGMCV